MTQPNASLLVLNDDCLLHLLKFLQLDDYINLSETCVRFADISVLALKKCTELTFDYRATNYSFEHIDRILFHIRQYLISLTLRGFKNAKYVLRKISGNHIHLRNLTCHQLPDDVFQNITSMNAFQNLEVLTLLSCNLGNNEDLFTNFYNLKSLYIHLCSGLHKNALQKYFETNHSITSFCCDDFEYRILPLLRNLETLYVLKKKYYLSVIFAELQTLNRLKSLKISGLWHKSENVLTELATKDILEELEIGGYILDNTIFAALKLFKRLRLLALTITETAVWKESFTLPPNLQHLTLDYFLISTTNIASLIKNLELLKNLQLRDCKIMDTSGSRIIDFTQKCHQISSGMVLDANRPTINVYFSSWNDTDYESKEIIDAGPLRFFCDPKYLDDPFVFFINIPGKATRL